MKKVRRDGAGIQSDSERKHAQPFDTQLRLDAEADESGTYFVRSRGRGAERADDRRTPPGGAVPGTPTGRALAVRPRGVV